MAGDVGANCDGNMPTAKVAGNGGGLANVTLTVRDTNSSFYADNSDHPSGGGGGTGNFRGIILLLVSVVLFAFFGLTVKLASNEFNEGQVLIFRSTCQGLSSWVGMRFYGIPILGPDGFRLRCILRGIVGAWATFMFNVGIANLLLGDATALFFTSPVFSAVLSLCIGSDRVTKVETLSIVIAVAGVTFVSRPSFLFPGESADNEFDGIAQRTLQTHTIGVLASLLGSLLGGLAPITVRMCGPKVHWLSLTFSLGLSAGIVACLGMWFDPAPTVWPSPFSNPYPYVVCIIGGICATGAQMLYNAGAKLETPTTTSLIYMLDVFLGALFQALILGNPLSWWSTLGMIFIVGSAVMLLLVKMSQKLRNYKKIFSTEKIKGMIVDEGSPLVGVMVAPLT